MSVFFKDQLAHVWDVKPQEKYVDLRITTSEKDKNGNYVNSTWFPRVYGKAAEQAKKFNKGDRVRIASGRISNVSKKMEDGKYKSVLDFRIFSFGDSGDHSGDGGVQGNPTDGGSEDMPY